MTTTIVSAQTKTYMDYADSVKIWMDERVKNAEAGKTEKVQVPMVIRGMGWGCLCPMHYIGISPSMADGPWISPIFPKKTPKYDDKGLSLIVTGYFTGKWITEDLRNADGEPEEWLYKMPEFKVLSWKLNKQDYDAPAPFVILSGGKNLKK